MCVSLLLERKGYSGPPAMEFTSRHFKRPDGKGARRAFNVFYDEVDGKRNLVSDPWGGLCWKCSGDEEGVRVINLKLEVKGLNIVSGYAPEVRYEAEEK